MNSPAAAETLLSIESSLPQFAVLQGGGDSEYAQPQGNLSLVPDVTDHQLKVVDPFKQAEGTVADTEKDNNTEGCIVAAEMPGYAERTSEYFAKIRASKVGELALKKNVDAKNKPIKNLREGIIWLKKGDQEGRDMAESNIATEAFEQIYKAGIVTKKKRLQTDSESNIYQNGQSLDAVHANALHLSSGSEVIRPRTEAEIKNNSTIMHGHATGLTKTHAYLVFSMTAEGVSDEHLDKLNFFSVTKPISVQMTTEDDEGLFMQSAFYAGVKDENGPRQDREIVEKTGDAFGADYRDKSAPEIIEHGVWVPKDFFKDKLDDAEKLELRHVIKFMDELNGGDTFYGQDKPKQDYALHEEQCHQLEDGFSDEVSAIADQLAQEIDQLPDAVAVCKRMAKLVQERMVIKAINDTSIDSRVFGKTASASIEKGRTAMAHGRRDEAMIYQIHALKTATSGSCPQSMESLAKLLGIKLEAEEEKRAGFEAWAGCVPKEGKCVNCSKDTMVGVESWCKGCIKGHCG